METRRSGRRTLLQIGGLTMRKAMMLAVWVAATLAMMFLLSWAFGEALDEELDSHSAQYWQGREY